MAEKETDTSTVWSAERTERAERAALHYLADRMVEKGDHKQIEAVIFMLRSLLDGGVHRRLVRRLEGPYVC